MMSLDEKADVMAGSCALSATSICRFGVNHHDPEICALHDRGHRYMNEKRERT
jgi:hypothetical protein